MFHKRRFISKTCTSVAAALFFLASFTNTSLSAYADSFEWRTEEENKQYWYENNIRQGTYDDPKGVLGDDDKVRGREIYDPVSGGWYWLDSVYNGAKAVSKEVWMPYIYQGEDRWSEAEIIENSLNSGDMAEQIKDAIHNHGNRESGKWGKWVRYDSNGAMIKGWYIVIGNDENIYPDQKGNIYYYDHMTGLMAKGNVVIDNVQYHFNEVTGVLDSDNPPDAITRLINNTSDETSDDSSNVSDDNSDSTKDKKEEGNSTETDNNSSENKADDRKDSSTSDNSSTKNKGKSNNNTNENNNSSAENEGKNETNNSSTENVGGNETNNTSTENVGENETNNFSSDNAGGNEVNNATSENKGENETNNLSSENTGGNETNNSTSENTGGNETNNSTSENAGGNETNNSSSENAGGNETNNSMENAGGNETNNSSSENAGGNETNNSTENAGENETNNSTSENSGGGETNNSSNEQATSILSQCTVGDVVSFGSYEQDNNLSNGKEPILWKVLSVSNGKALLLSEYALDYLQYHNVGQYTVTWETCSLRAWLNNDFYNSAFDSNAQSKIVLTENVNESNQKSMYGTGAGGNNTLDRVFCLSQSDIKNNLSYNDWKSGSMYGFCEDLIAPATEYACSKGATNEVISESYYNSSLKNKHYSTGCIGKSGCIWWLRSPGNIQYRACYVDQYGKAGETICNYDTSYYAVRPAMWVSMN